VLASLGRFDDSLDRPGAEILDVDVVKPGLSRPNANPPFHVPFAAHRSTAMEAQAIQG
jgi:hypothetical protein